MKKFFYAAIAAIALMVVSCAQKTPAEEALANYKVVMEKVINFDGNEEEFNALMQEYQKVAAEVQKYVTEYDQKTLDELAEPSEKALDVIIGKMASQQSDFDDEMEEMTDELETEIAEIEEEITED